MNKVFKNKSQIFVAVILIFTVFLAAQELYWGDFPEAMTLVGLGLILAWFASNPDMLKKNFSEYVESENTSKNAYWAMFGITLLFAGSSSELWDRGEDVEGIMGRIMRGMTVSYLGGFVAGGVIGLGVGIYQMVSGRVVSEEVGTMPLFVFSCSFLGGIFFCSLGYFSYEAATVFIVGELGDALGGAMYKVTH